MSELGDHLVNEPSLPINATVGDFEALRRELIALRQYHTLAESMGPIQAANKRTESWKQVALDTQAKHRALITALRELADELAEVAEGCDGVHAAEKIGKALGERS